MCESIKDILLGLKQQEEKKKIFSAVKDQIRGEMGWCGDHTIDIKKLGDEVKSNAGRYTQPEYQRLDDGTIHCPIPRYACHHRNQFFKYGCDEERRDCALNMMYRADLDCALEDSSPVNCEEGMDEEYILGIVFEGIDGGNMGGNDSNNDSESDSSTDVMK